MEHVAEKVPAALTLRPCRKHPQEEEDTRESIFGEATQGLKRTRLPAPQASSTPSEPTSEAALKAAPRAAPKAPEKKRTEKKPKPPGPILQKFLGLADERTDRPTERS